MVMLVGVPAMSYDAPAATQVVLPARPHVATTPRRHDATTPRRNRAPDRWVGGTVPVRLGAGVFAGVYWMSNGSSGRVCTIVLASNVVTDPAGWWHIQLPRVSRAVPNSE